MSTTSITFRKSSPSYTVIGQNPSDQNQRGSEITVLILQRGTAYQRKEYIQAVFDNGFFHVVSLEWKSSFYDRESLASRFPGLQFIVFQDTELEVGQILNLAFEEIHNQYIYVIWSDMVPQSLHHMVFDQLIDMQSVAQVPSLRDNKGALIPSLVTPAMDGDSLKVLFLPPGREGETSLYPFDFIGIYNRQKYIQLGGFDEHFTSDFWQKMDFGYRAYLWGEQIIHNSRIRVEAQQEIEVEDMTVQSCYRRFYLKNLAIEFHSDHASLSSKRFLSFWRKSGLNYFKARREFKIIQDWVETQKYRYKSDASYVTELWGETGDF